MRKQILTAEYIGKIAIVFDKKTMQQIAAGKIVDETKNTFQLKTITGDKKKIVKKNSFLQMIFLDKTIKIDGQLLAKRSEDRVKLK